MNGQPLLSMADAQWVLHHVPAEGGRVALEVRRSDQTLQTTLRLEDGWRRRGDISWRVASWGMRRIATGGMKLEPLTAEQRQETAIEQPMALRAAHVGQWGALKMHAC